MDARPYNIWLWIIRPVALARASRRTWGAGHRKAKRWRAAFYREVWGEAASRLGATLVQLGTRAVEVRRGGRSARLEQNLTPLDDPGTMALAGDKPGVHRLLADGGLPIPRHVAFRAGDLAPALAFLKQADGPCVVKPAFGGGAGRGVTTGVRTPTHLVEGAAAASVYGEGMLIEELVSGDNYRLLYLDGELLDSVLRLPPTRVGDGRSTIRRLIRRDNAGRLDGGHPVAQVLLTAGPDMRLTLAAQGLTLGSIPPAGAAVRVKTAVNENRGPDNVPATGRLSPAVVEAGRRAAAASGARLAGVDLITTDPGLPLEQSGGVILEVNTTPGLYYHYAKRGGSTPVAVPILARILECAPDRGRISPTPSPVASCEDPA